MLKIGRVALSLAESQSTVSDAQGNRVKPWEDIHTNLTIILEGKGPGSRTYSARMSFVELAPPEPREDPAAKASAGALRSKMVGFSSLQAVVTALQVATAKARAGKTLAHIPWRDSPLTRWLKDPLFLAASVLMVGTVSASVEAAPDTLATMHWASRLRPTNRSRGIIVTPVWDRAGRSLVTESVSRGGAADETEPAFDFGDRSEGAGPYASIEVSSSGLMTSIAREAPEVSSGRRQQQASPGRDRSPGQLRLEDRDNMSEVASRRPVTQVLMSDMPPSRVQTDRLLARSMEADMQAYSELMETIRSSGNQGYLRAQAVLQRLIEEHGQLRAALVRWADT